MSHGGGVDDGDAPRGSVDMILPDEIQPLRRWPALHVGQRGDQCLRAQQGGHQLDEVGAAQPGQRVAHGDVVGELAVGRQRGLGQRQVLRRGDGEEPRDGRGLGLDVVVGQPDAGGEGQQLRALGQDVVQDVPLAALARDHRVGLEFRKVGDLLVGREHQRPVARRPRGLGPARDAVVGADAQDHDRGQGGSRGGHRGPSKSLAQASGARAASAPACQAAMARRRPRR